MHFNLNPTNVIRSPDGSVKVTGFGLMDMLGPEFLEQLMALPVTPIKIGTRRIVINTLDTLSPEVRQGIPGDVRSDLYALGMLGYYLLTGHKPESGEAYRPPSHFSGAIPSRWDETIGKCLYEEPDERFKNLDAFLSSLKAVNRVAPKPVQETVTISDRIDQIPIPKSVAERIPEKFRRGLRLGILGIFAVLIIGLASLFFKIIFEEEREQVGPVVKRTPPGEQPQLSIMIKPVKSRITFVGKGSFIISDGRLNVNMPRGGYTIMAEAKDYKSAQLRLEVDKERIDVPFKLQLAWANFELRSDPGALVVLIRKTGETLEFGPIPEDGVLNLKNKVISDTYDIEISRENYSSALLEDVFLPVGKPIIQEQKLVPLPGGLTVVTEPEGANVFLDTKYKGKSPLELEDLEVNRPFALAVTLDGYRRSDHELTLAPGQVVTHNFGKLERRAGNLASKVTFDGEPPPSEMLKDLTISLTGRTQSVSTGVVREVDEGEQQVTISHPDYFPWSDTVTIEDKRTTMVTADLKPRPGLLRVATDPKVAVKLVANKRSIEAKNNVFALPSGKEINLELQARDYLTIKRKISFRPNQQHEWKVQLRRIPGPTFAKKWLVPYVGVRLNWISPGTFAMGSPLPEQARLPSEGPRTFVEISKGFWIGVFEVSQSEYKVIAGTNPSRFQGARKPVDKVSWDDAVAFCEKISRQEKAGGRLPEGYEYRLPTEAEWEYACRAGTESPFSFGDEADSTFGNLKGAYPREFEDPEIKKKEIYPSVVSGQYEANAFGLYDLHGNVREWCWDRFNSRLPGGQVVDWKGPEKGSDRVYRGGGWEDFAPRCRAAARERLKPSTVSSALGFRLLLGPEL